MGPGRQRAGPDASRIDTALQRGADFRAESVDRPRKARDQIVGDAPVKIAVEAAIRMGWDPVIGTDGIFVGMTGFGASAPYKDLYRRFGITAEAIVAAARAGLGDNRREARKERA